MRIGIDARMYGKISRGIGRYLEEYLRELEKIDHENEYFIFLYSKNFDDYHPQNPNFKKVLAPWIWYSLAEQIKFPKLLKKYNLDLVHFPHFNVPYFYNRPYVLTIHDLILWFDNQKPATTLGPVKYFFKKIAYKFIIKNAIKKAKKIIAISEYTKKDISKIMPEVSEKIDVVYEGVSYQDLECKIDDKSLKIRYNIGKSFIFYVGAAYPHKCLSFLVDNWTFIKEHFDYQLLFVGKKDEFYRKIETEIKEKNLENDILLLGYVDDHDLACLFTYAEAFIFPSRYEGFGLPPLEALAKHCPVLASNKTCIPEVLGDKAVYFEYTQESLFDAIKNIPKAKMKLENIDEWLKKYSWKKMAEEILKIYKG